MTAVKIQMSYPQGACELGLKYFRTENLNSIPKLNMLLGSRTQIWLDIRSQDGT